MADCHIFPQRDINCTANAELSQMILLEQDICPSLQLVEPLPLEIPDDEKEDSMVNSAQVSGATLKTGRSPVYYFMRLQRYSSYVFGVFAGVHLANTSLIPLVTQSVEASESYLLLTRPYYHNFPLEEALITVPIVLHITAGVALRLHRRRIKQRQYGTTEHRQGSSWPPISWSSVSGYMLTPLVVGHAFLNRILPWIHEGGSSGVGLGYVSHGFARHPILAATSYLTLIGLAAGHFTWGLAKWRGWLPADDGRNARRRWWAIQGVTAAVAVSWMAGSLGVVARGGRADGWVGRGYDVLYGRVGL
ncbi:unnamed protein product [Blumeria hordei]|uniref:Mitochondrial adapter protein MCP1 transmembrane domain-containing protein n=1 Tax=Blumeria hordei TaxID=2867405 RepID=A0A383UX63_BLUHO|nr:unnamed protein product [Blumeria hordei]